MSPRFVPAALPAVACAATVIAAGVLTGCTGHDGGLGKKETVYVTTTQESGDTAAATAGSKEEPTGSTPVVTVTEKVTTTSTVKASPTKTKEVSATDPDGIPPFPGAGGGAPANARQASYFNDTIYEPAVKYAAVRNRSGSVYCGMLPGGDYEHINCVIPALQATGKYGKATEPYEENLHQVVFQPDGTAELWPTSGGPLSTANISAQYAEPIEDGDAVIFGDNVCVGHDDGLTCWVIGSGHGADLADNYFRAF